MPITPTFVTDLETGMRIIQDQEYNRLTPLVNEIWGFVKRQPSSGGAKERLFWMLETAGIQYVDKYAGSVQFEELLTTYLEYEYKAATAGLEINRFKLEDIGSAGGVPGGEGIEQAQNWTRQVTAQATYWPRGQTFTQLNNGDQAGFTTYDGKKFFDTAHPVNVFDASLGTFNNVFTGGASGSYPGACPIDASVTLDVAFSNFAKVIAYIEGAIKMPNGTQPRMLRVKELWVPSALKVRAQQLTNARQIPAAAASGGGTLDVENTIKNWGIGEPHVAPELGAAFANGSDTSYYVMCESVTSSQLGGIIYGEREPFGITYNSGLTDAQLQRANSLQWVERGRNVLVYGHPFLIFKVKAS
jgi:hypothetical protein